MSSTRSSYSLRLDIPSLHTGIDHTPRQTGQGKLCRRQHAWALFAWMKNTGSRLYSFRPSWWTDGSNPKHLRSGIQAIDAERARPTGFGSAEDKMYAGDSDQSERVDRSERGYLSCGGV